MKTIALHNLKGGVGKTTAAVNLAYLAAEEGIRTLLCDLDAQAAASYYLHVDPGGVGAGKLVKGGSKVEQAVVSTPYENLDVLPGSIAFRNLAVKLSEAKKSTKQLRTTLKQFSAYDLLVIDASAGLDLESEGVFRAADMVLVPTIPTTLSVRALDTVRSFVGSTSKPPSLYAFLSMVDGRRKLHRQTVDALVNEDYVLPVVIPYASDVEKMGLEQAPFLARHRRSASARAYLDLWANVHERLNRQV